MSDLSTPYDSADPSAPVLSEYERAQKIDLKNPVLAGFLTWLIPGLGQYYQGRTIKAALFFLCIIPTFVVGCLLGSSPETGPARNVYYSWRTGDKRLHFIPQACLGIAAIPAGLQAFRLNAGDPPLFGRFMAPSQLHSMDRTGMPPTLGEVMYRLNFLFELGTYLTIIAGLMNLLAIFDAIDGPLVYRPEEKKDKATDESDGSGRDDIAL